MLLDHPHEMFAKRTNWNLTRNRLSEALAQHRAAGKSVLDLTPSNPTECEFVYDEATILNALRNPQALTYDPEPHGLISARQAVVQYYAERGSCASADDVFLTTSTSEAYAYAFRLLCDPGDEVLVPAPSYPLFDFLADLQDVRLLRYPLLYDHGWQMDFPALEQKVTSHTRALIVVHPNNPTGHFAKPAEIERLNALCSGRELAILADEVFLDFSLGPERAKSFVGNSEALTITMSGLSKICGLPQMKAAWLCVSGPGDRKRAATARLEIIADTYLSMNAPVQLAIPEFLTQGHRFQDQWMARVKQNLGELDRQLAGQKACRRLELEGGWYVVLRVPAIGPDEDLALSLLDGKGVYVHPGHFYDFPSEGFLVVSLICAVREFSAGLARTLAHFH